MKTTIYSPEPVLGHPGVLVRRMIADLMASRGLAWRLVVRNLSAQYRQTLLGWFWAFFPPLATTATFLLLRKGGQFEPGDTGVPYLVFMLVGTTLWQTFAESVQAPLQMVTQSTAMLVKINFPREALILAGMGQVLFNFAIRSSILVAVFVYMGVVPPVTALLFPVALLVLMLCGTMTGLMLTPLGMLYKDIEKAMSLVMTFWMLLSGVVYAPPASGTSMLGTLTHLNPATALIQTGRDWLVVGPSPYTAAFLWTGLAAFFLLLLAWMLYRIAMPHLIARLGG